MLWTQIVTDFSDFPSAWKKSTQIFPQSKLLELQAPDFLSFLRKGQLADTQNIRYFTALFDSSFDLSLKEKLWILVWLKADGINALFKDWHINKEWCSYEGEIPG